MRLAPALAALIIANPALAGAQERTRPPPPASAAAAGEGFRSDPGPAARADRPPPPDSGRPPPPPPPDGRRGPWGPPPPDLFWGPGWWGWGWGWGYEPLLSYPERRGYAEHPPYDGASPGHRRPLGATLRVTGASGSADGSAVGLAFAVDGRHAGFDLAVDAFAPSRGGVMTGGLHDTQDAYGLGSAHVSYPILAGAAYRLRLLAGASWLSVPAASSLPSAEAVGFDLGLSGSLGLVGPLGLEGHARVTPFPVQVIDLRAALALRAGPLSLLAGYRVIDLAGDSRTGPAARFEGPELGLGLIF